LFCSALTWSLTRRRDRLVSLGALVLVEQGGPWCIVAHPGHQVTQAGTGLRGQGVAGVPEVMKVQARHTDRRCRRLPTDQGVEVAPP
jgi:hypothetical protein